MGARRDATGVEAPDRDRRQPPRPGRICGGRPAGSVGCGVEVRLVGGDTGAECAQDRRVAERHEPAVAVPPARAAGRGRGDPDDDRVGGAEFAAVGAEIAAQPDAPAVAGALEEDVDGDPGAGSRRAATASAIATAVPEALSLAAGLKSATDRSSRNASAISSATVGTSWIAPIVGEETPPAIRSIAVPSSHRIAIAAIRASRG